MLTALCYYVFDYTFQEIEVHGMGLTGVHRVFFYFSVL